MGEPRDGEAARARERDVVGAQHLIISARTGHDHGELEEGAERDRTEGSERGCRRSVRNPVVTSRYGLVEPSPTTTAPPGTTAKQGEQMPTEVAEKRRPRADEEQRLSALCGGGGIDAKRHAISRASVAAQEESSSVAGRRSTNQAGDRQARR